MRKIGLGLATLSILGASVFSIAATATATAATQTDRSGSLIPVDYFAEMPDTTDLRLSPSGTHMAYLSHTKGYPALIVTTLDGRQATEIGNTGRSEVTDFRWANDEQLVLTHATRTRAERVFGLSFVTRLMGVNRDGSGARWLVRLRDDEELPIVQNNIVSMLPGDPEHILVGLDFDRDGASGVYRLNLNDQGRRLIEREKQGAEWWSSDHLGRPRMAKGFTYGPRAVRDEQLFVLDRQENWVNARRLPWGKRARIGGFAERPDQLYALLPQEGGPQAAYLVTVGNEVPPAPLFALEDRDVAEFVTHPLTEEVVGIAYYEGMRRVKYFDTDLQRVQSMVEAMIPDSSVDIVDQIAGTDQYLIFVTSDRDSGTYFMVNGDTGAMSMITKQYEHHDPNLMSQTVRKSYSAADGTTIEAMVTWPRGRDRLALPTVVLPHGGPHWQATAVWDEVVQFIASRGYLVIQPNYRGSTGYGSAFEESGRGEWGGLIQSDIADAARWAIAEGMADASRVCIVGGGFGGYSALLSSIQSPDLFQCAAAFNPITDLVRVKERFSRIAASFDWNNSWGEASSEDKEVSPHHRAKDVGTPILLFHSKDDPKLDWRLTKSFADKLDRLDKEVTFVTASTGRRDLQSKEARLTFMTALEQFLAKHLAEPPVYAASETAASEDATGR